LTLRNFVVSLQNVILLHGFIRPTSFSSATIRSFGAIPGWLVFTVSTILKRRSTMEQQIKRLVAVLATTALLSACSSGGGGGGAAAPAADQSVSVSGAVVASAGPASAASASKQAVTQPQEGAKITIKSYDKSGVLKETIETVSGTSGGFATSVTALGGGGVINVKAESNNAVAFEKSFTYTTAAELSAGLQVAATLDAVTTRVIPVPTSATNPVLGFDKAAANTDMLSIAVVTDAKGRKSIVSNSQIQAAKAAGSEVTWQIDVNKGFLKAAGSTELTVKAQNYNPANSDDMTRFPSDSTDTGDKLISASFDFIDIKDQDGKALSIPKASAKEIRKSAQMAYAVRKMIPDCGLILKDEDATTPGVQIGFYFMRNGKWNKLGMATLYDDTGNATTDATLHTLNSCTSSKRPYAVLTDKDVSKDIDFDLKWFNFDYVAFGDIKTACVEGKVNLKKASDASLVGYGGVNLYLNTLEQGSPAARVTGFQSSSGYTKNDGSYKMDFSYSSTTLSSPTATIGYYDSGTGQQSSFTAALSAKNAAGCYTIADKVIEEPACTVSGKVLKVDGTTPASDRWVSVYQALTYTGNRGAQTNATGAYSLPVFCGVDYKLEVDGTAKNFNVNSVVGSDESSDASNAVVMKDIVKANNAPRAYINADSRSMAVSNSTNLYGYAYDPDGDAVTYAWSDNCGGTFGSAITASTTWKAPATAPANNLCTLTLVATDSVKASGTATAEIYISTSGNRPPIIANLFVPRFATSGSTGNALSAYAYDVKGLPLSYAWTASCGTLTNNTATPQNPTWAAPVVATQTDCTVTATVTNSDSSVTPATTLSSTKSAIITVNPNKPPSITSFFAPASATMGSVNALSASAFDVNYDALSWGLTIVSGGGTLSGTCSGTVAAGSGYLSSTGCSYTAPSTAGNVVLRFSVSDSINPAVTSDKTINVTTATGSTTVTVQ
jgi:hypothetical protein